MKLTLRMQQAMIHKTLTQSVLLVFFWAIFYFFLLDNLKIVQAQKEEIQTLSEQNIRISTQGMNFQDFSDYVWQLWLSSGAYLSLLMQKIDENFYENHFTNTGSEDYATFLKNLKIQVQALNASEKMVEQNALVEKIIPSYSQNAGIKEKWLSDFYFANYLENLMYSFRLEAEGSIGIGDIQKIDLNKKPWQWSDSEQSQEVDPTTLLEQDIYAIPITFSLTGQKGDILDFIHYLENVGSVKYDENGLQMYQDTKLTKIIPKREQQEEVYNIYKNQLSDIQSILMPKYIDSSSVTVLWKSLDEKVRATQSREKFITTLTINFYISWTPAYKLQEYADTFFWASELFQTQVKDMVNTYASQKESLGWEKKLAYEKLISLEMLIDALREEIKTMQAEESQTLADDGSFYDTIYILDSKLTVMKRIYNEIEFILEEK